MKLPTVNGLKKIFSQKPKTRPQITLLVIGATECGKTALIYFLKRFAFDHLLVDNPDAGQPLTTVTNGVANHGRLLDEGNSVFHKQTLVDFVKDIQKDVLATGRFQFTNPGGCNYITFDFPHFDLLIYNLPGEWFSEVAGDHVEKLQELAQRLDGVDTEHTYTILCSESSTQARPFNKDIVYPGFKNSRNAIRILSNITEGKNTLRVLTKFDKQFKLASIETGSGHQRQRQFDIYNPILYELNCSAHNYYKQHENVFRNPELPVINVEKHFRKFFLCTGLYDRNDPGTELFENSEADQKPKFKKEYLDNLLNNVNMYGVEEIWEIILRSAGIVDEFLYFNKNKVVSSTRYKISERSYNRIIGKEN